MIEPLADLNIDGRHMVLVRYEGEEMWMTDYQLQRILQDQVDRVERQYSRTTFRGFASPGGAIGIGGKNEIVRGEKIMKPVPKEWGLQTETRIGDEDRAKATDRLGEAMALGYLDQQEYSSRMSYAASAKTKTELDRVFEDLPRGPEVRTFPLPQRRSSGRIPLLVACIACIAGWVALIVGAAGDDVALLAVAPLLFLVVAVYGLIAIGKRNKR